MISSSSTLKGSSSSHKGTLLSSKRSRGKRGGKAHQADAFSKDKPSNNDEYQASSAIAFASMATIVPPVHPLPPKPQSQVRAPKLTDRLSEQCPSQVGPIRGPLAHAQEKVLKLYDKHLARRFPGPTLVEAPASKIIELSSEAPSP